jgi:Leucine-rich repeat (LRR) protein
MMTSNVFSAEISCEINACQPNCCQCTTVNMTVICHGLGLTRIPKEIPLKTTYLHIYDNDIATIDNTSFATLTDLTVLILDNNNIQELVNGAFIKLRKLETLQISSNPYFWFDDRAFEGLAHVMSLNLAKNGLSEWPDFSSSLNLEDLNLESNLFEELQFPEAFKTMKTFKKIALGGNPISTFSIGGWSNVLVANIFEFSYVSDHYVPSYEANFFTTFSGLRKVVMGITSHSGRQTVPIGSLSSVATLAELYIIGNKYSLKGLSLIPSQLQILYLTDFVDSDLQKETFASLTHLKTLTIKNVQVRNIEDQCFSALIELDTLIVTGTLLSSARLTSSNMPPFLKNLSLAENSVLLKSGDLPHTLTYLNMFRTTLQEVDFNVFRGLIHLEFLDVTGTFREHGLSKSLFAELHSLKTLILSDNGIETLESGIFSSLKLLKYLDLSHNAIKYFSDIDRQVLQPLLKLSFISLTNNNILTVQPTQLLEQYFQKEESRIDLSENPLDCDCQNMLLYRLVNDKLAEHVVSLSNYVCSSPPEYSGTYFANKTTISKIEFNCKYLLYIYIASPVAGALILSVLASIVGYKNRWYIRWLFYKVRRSRPHVSQNREGQLGDSNSDAQPPLQYAAYLSYFPDDTPWLERLVDHLEHEEHSEEQNVSRAIPDVSIPVIKIDEQDYDEYDEDDKALTERQPLLGPVQQGAGVSEQRQPQFLPVNCRVGLSDVRQPPLTTANPRVNTSEISQLQPAPVDNEVSVGELECLQPLVAIANLEVRISESHQSLLAPDNFRVGACQPNRRVYYEDRDAVPGRREMDEICDAIYSSENIIVCLSPEYLRDARRRFELELTQAAMVERHGPEEARSHIIFITRHETGELLHLVPKELRSSFVNTCLVWERENSIQEQICWAEIDRLLTPVLGGMK